MSKKKVVKKKPVKNVKATPKIFEVNAYDDTIYVNAASEDHAYEHVKDIFGEIPRDVLEINEIKKLPKGKELF